MSSGTNVANELDEPTREFVSAIFLDDMPAPDSFMPLVSSARHVSDKDTVQLAKNGVVLSEDAEKRLLPAAQSLPRGPVSAHSWVVRVEWNELGECPSSSLVLLGRKRCIVRGNLFRPELDYTPAANDASRGKPRRPSRECPPQQQRRPR